MNKMPLATQIPKELKSHLDHLCAEKGWTLSHVVTEAIRDKLEELREEEALIRMALERLAEPGERSYAEYRRVMRLRRM